MSYSKSKAETRIPVRFGFLDEYYLMNEDLLELMRENEIYQLSFYRKPITITRKMKELLYGIDEYQRMDNPAMMVVHGEISNLPDIEEIKIEDNNTYEKNINYEIIEPVKKPTGKRKRRRGEDSNLGINDLKDFFNNR